MMGKFEYGLIGVMAFLIVGILGAIAVSDPEPFESKKRTGGLTMMEPMVLPDKEEMMDTMESSDEHMVHTHEVIIPEGTSVPGCEETDECFLPAFTPIIAGHSVMWQSEDNVIHTVTSGNPLDGHDGEFDSNLLTLGETFEHTFENPGTYEYYCIVHPWMIGIVQVG